MSERSSALILLGSMDESMVWMEGGFLGIRMR